MTEPVPPALPSRWQPPPQDLLDRHDARILRPAEALRLSGDFDAARGGRPQRAVRRPTRPEVRRSEVATRARMACQAESGRCGKRVRQLSR